MARQAARTYSLAEISALARVPVALLERALRAPHRLFFPHAVELADGWRVPESDVRAWMSRRLEPHYSLEDVAALLSLSYDHVWRLARSGALPSVKFAGCAQRRVAESVILSRLSPA